MSLVLQRFEVGAANQVDHPQRLFANIMQVLQAPKGPSRVAKAVRPWIARATDGTSPEGGDIRLFRPFGAYDSRRVFVPGPHGPGYTTSPLRG
jgi:hypothetical protein